MLRRSKRKPVQDSWPAAHAFDGLTALALLSFLVTLGCDVAPEGSPADDAGNQPDPELGAVSQPQRSGAEPSGVRERSTGAAQSSSDAAGRGGSGERAAQADAPDDGASNSTLAGRTPRVVARAALEPTAGNDVTGSVEFIEAAHGVEIVASVQNLAPGTHGMHVHESGDCSTPDASSAGDHFTPEGDPHGAPRDEPSAHHAGDLGNITADDSSNAEKRMTDPELQIEGEYGVVGRAVIVHEGEDDLTSQPSGESGDPVACGVIELVNISTDRV